MRCTCCNRNLSDYESTLRHPVTNEFLDICSKCLKDIPISPLASSSKQDDIGYEDDSDVEDFFDTEYYDEDE